jgi:hypothetical protein
VSLARLGRATLRPLTAETTAIRAMAMTARMARVRLVDSSEDVCSIGLPPALHISTIEEMIFFD